MNERYAIIQSACLSTPVPSLWQFLPHGLARPRQQHASPLLLFLAEWLRP